jgi:quinohemoprotein amine dehydrogenase
VKNPLLSAKCASCHVQDKDGMMSRISYERKSPEGWSTSLKRMLRLYDVKLTPEEAKQIVRYLADEHGLTRSEAAKCLYESERRVHWSEEEADQDLKQACAQCHALGRVYSQQRDDEEWKALRSMHVAYYPLSRGQMGGGPPRSDRERQAMEGFGNFAIPGEASAPAGGRGNQGNQGNQQSRNPQLDRGDRVLAALAKELPLFTPEWEKWANNRREVPLGGTWTVTGHEVGHGDCLGTLELTRTAENEYDTRWDLTFQDGSQVQRSGKGLLYCGYSWRGRTVEPAPDKHEWREVLLLDEPWLKFEGRVFTGEYDEIGIDVKLYRHQGISRVLAARNRAIIVPSRGHVLELHGDAFAADVKKDDFHLGAGITATACERVSETLVRLTVDVAPTAESGERQVALGGSPGVATVVLYDSIDYVKVLPLRGMARVGGVKYPKQLERFECWTMNRGRDGKPYTEDDFQIAMVPAQWALREFSVREDDDDLKYVGTIDAATGLVTPGIDGPNPERRWQANNVGDVYVEATVKLDVPVRGEQQDEPANADDKTGGIAVIKAKDFKARAHLLVTVPKYVRFDRLDWGER